MSFKHSCPKSVFSWTAFGTSKRLKALFGLFGRFRNSYFIGLGALLFNKNARSATIAALGQHFSFEEPEFPLTDGIP